MFNNKLKNIDINKIQANENQPITVFNEEKIEELQQALEVTRKKISYYEAALQAGTENALPPAFCLRSTQK